MEPVHALPQFRPAPLQDHPPIRRRAQRRSADGPRRAAPGPVAPRAAERCRSGGACALAINPVSYWQREGRSPEADDSLDGVHEATQSGLPILRVGNIDRISDAQPTRNIALSCTLVSPNRITETQASAICDTARGKGTDIAAEAHNEDQIEVAAAIIASAIVVNRDEPDRMPSLGTDIAQPPGHLVAAAKVPPIGAARARFGEFSDAGYDAAMVPLDPKEDPGAVMGSLADQTR